MEEILMEDWNGQNKQLSNFECAAQTGGIAGYFLQLLLKKVPEPVLRYSVQTKKGEINYGYF